MQLHYKDRTKEKYELLRARKQETKKTAKKESASSSTCSFCYILLIVIRKWATVQFTFYGLPNFVGLS